MILLVSALWPHSASNAEVHVKAAEVVAAIDLEARKMGLLREFVYANYAD